MATRNPQTKTAPSDLPVLPDKVYGVFALNRALQGIRFPLHHFVVLLAIYHYEGTMNSRELDRILWGENRTRSQQVYGSQIRSKLENQGMIEMDRDPGDKRYRSLRLTEKGHDLVTSIRKRIRNYE